jgi:small-conductance mechanosensitive channel/CRP-like cAMP-binding protein
VAFAARLVNWLVWDGLVARRTGVRVPALLRQLGLMLVIGVGTVGMLSSVYGISFATLVTASGALGIVIGLAFKDILSDFFSGVVLNLEQPFVLDEWISVGEGSETCVGCVKEINWRGTRLLTSEGNLIVMRNGHVLTAKLCNFSRPLDASEFEVELCFPFGTDRMLLESVLTAAVSEAQSHQDILAEPAPRVLLKRIDSAGLTYILTYCINLKVTSRKTARSTVLTAVARHLRFNGLEPAPQSQVVTIGQGVPAPDPHDAEGLLRIRQLQQIELLRSLTDAERADLASKIESRQFATGESVVRVGEEGASMFVVISGHLEVAIPSGGENLVRVATLGPGDFFGEMSMLTGASRTATVIPLVPSQLYEISHEIVGDLIEARPALADELSRIAAERRLRSEAATTARDSKASTAGLRASLAAAISQGIEKFFGRGKARPQ